MAALFDTGALERLRRREREAEALAIRFYPPVVCTHVVGEFLYGMAWAQVSAAAFNEGREFLESFDILTPSSATALVYSRLRAELRRSGHQIPDADTWIAAHAIESRLPLVTLDGHFDLFPGLNVHRLNQIG